MIDFLIEDYLVLEVSYYQQTGSVAGAYSTWLTRKAANDALTPLAMNSKMLKAMQSLIPRDLTQRPDLDDTPMPPGTKPN